MTKKSKSAKNPVGIVLIALGVVSLLSAGGLYLHNIIEENSAAKSSDHAAQILLERITENKNNQYQIEEAVTTPPDTDEASEAAPDEASVPNTNPTIVDTTPVVEIEGQNYIGVLSIPTLKLQWPINSEWSYSKLKLSPCRYSGSAEEKTLTIAAHNYRYHFGRFTNLEVGDKVLFTDTTGKKYQYRIEEIETIEPTSVDKVINSKFDLNLFTCNYNGDARIAVKCKLYNNP